MKWVLRISSWVAIVIFISFRGSINSEAGFACVSNPCVYGICIDDINSTYTCYCINGYTGIQCQTNWDECWSSPCLNGATCIDGIDAYNCSCTEGYTGTNCELDINECASNPCTNNGTCVDIPNGFTCQCNLGYSGSFCDIDLAVCNSSNELRCHNGGLCIDGPGLTYTCECQPGWTGALCESEINECASSPCQNGAVCIDLHADYSCACLFGFTGHSCETELALCDMNLCANGALCLIEDDVRVCYCVPDYHGDKCQYQYDECVLRGRCYNGGTCVDGVDNYTCSCPPRVSGFHCECVIDSDGNETCDVFSSTPVVFDTTSIYETDTSKFTDFTTKYFNTSLSLPTTLSTKFDSDTVSSQGTTTPPFTTELTTLITQEEIPTTITESKQKPTSIEVPETTTPQETTETEYSETTTVTEIAKTQTISLPTSPQTTSTTLETITYPNTTISTDRTTSVSVPFSETKYPTTTTAFLTTVPESTTQSKFSTFDTTAKSSVIIPSNSTVQLTTTECCETSVGFTDVTETGMFFERSTEFATSDDEWYVTKFIDETTITTVSTQCSNITCLNGGTCEITKDGPKCSCRFGWEGLQCEEAITIKVVAFTGRSYLIHNLNNGTSTIVSLKLKTLSSFGIIFYAQVTSDMYMCLYIQNGFLKFQFSCGVQSMEFSETKYRVNTGYQLQILATVSMNKNLQSFDESECSAALKINNTIVMSGLQTTATVQKLLNLPALYIGGFPRYLVQQLDLPVINGIIGCMHSLQVDGLPKDIYMDAYDGNEISECSSLACISSPCHHSATCIENGQSWTCLCPLGFVGDTCNISVCINNPCHFGATCIQYPTNGFLCLCPLGKHGLFCEQDLEITQPTFTSTVRGYSSFIAYQLPSSSVQHTFELRFKFIPETMEQIALMVFMGQNGQHDVHSDHLALSFIKGYIALTWNLGAGPRRIFTPRPIAKKGKKMHSIRIGRTGSRAWLFVDGFKNITGRAPGRFMQLNVTPHIFIGGHESYNFLTLPHDLPLHTGFAGCIYDVEMRTSHVTLGLQKTHPEIGRSVAQCGTSECSNYTCQHGGVCVQHGPTYSCLCPDGWFGPVCAYRHNLCDSNYHKCVAGSTCVPVALTYECDCPVGQTGKFCEKFESQLSDISFSGRRSYLLTNPKEEFQIKQFNFELEFKPLNDRAIIMYVTENTSMFFTALILKGGILEFRMSSFEGNKNPEADNTVVKVRSGTIINTGKWTKIRAGRFGQKLYLTVNGFTNSKLIPLDTSLTYDNISVYFGGIRNFADVPYEVVSGLPTSFSGCVRQFFINYKHIVLNENSIVDGRNIADCDGTPCGADVCGNGGTCWLNTTLKPHCMCPEEYNGERCQIQVSCAKVPCKNNGRCVEGSKGLTCHCPLGWIGPFCDKEMPSLTPFLKDDSYIIIDKRPSKKRQSSGNRTSVDLIHIKFSTTQDNGMLLWNMKDQNFFGIGIENGNLKIVWSIDGTLNQYVLTSNITVNNGVWHTLLFKFNDTEILSSIDNEDIYLSNQTLKYFLNSDGLFYLGGFPDNKYVLNETNGIFSSNFNGCIKEFAWNEYAVVTNFKKYKGENVGSCFEYKG